MLSYRTERPNVFWLVSMDARPGRTPPPAAPSARPLTIVVWFVEWCSLRKMLI